MWNFITLQDPYPDPPQITNFTDLTNLFDRFIEFLPRLAFALVIFLVGIYIAKLVSRLVHRGLVARKIKLQIVQVITRITYWSTVILITTIALQTIGFNLSAFLAGLGILGFTVGFALQDVSKNFIAGLLLLLSQPFDVGDVIEVNGYSGTVQSIELRATEMKTLDGKHVQIPNADVLTNPLTNFTRNKLRRIELSVGIAYGTDLEKVRRVTLETIRNVPGVLEDPAPTFVYREFGDSAINFTLYYWIDQTNTLFLDMSDSGFVAVESAFAREQIEIPFPVRTVYLQKSA